MFWFDAIGFILFLFQKLLVGLGEEIVCEVGAGVWSVYNGKGDNFYWREK